MGGSSDELRLGRKSGAARVREFDPARALDARRETATIDGGTDGSRERVQEWGVEMDME